MKPISISLSTVLSLFQIFLIVYYFSFKGTFRPISQNSQFLNNNSTKLVESSTHLINLFYEIASDLGIDKAWHKYHVLYGIHLGPMRHKPLNLLEIGLGCKFMKYGPGKSLIAWKKYLTHPETMISFLEYDRQCAEKFNPPVVTNMFIGDQADEAFLKHVGGDGGPYHVIIDDGGHKRSQQVKSFLGLWHHVYPNGGIYVIEDVYFTFYENFADQSESAIEMIRKLIFLLNEYNKSTNDRVFKLIKVNESIGPELVEVAKSILSINCYFRACVIVKK